MHTYVWEPHIYEGIRDPTCTRDSELERKYGCVRHAELRMSKVPWGLQKVIAGC